MCILACLSDGDFIIGVDLEVVHILAVELRIQGFQVELVVRRFRLALLVDTGFDRLQDEGGKLFLGCHRRLIFLLQLPSLVTKTFILLASL